MITLRRYLSLCALLFWQGGFTFYAQLVIPITRQVLHDHGQLPLAALITGPATNWLNGIGVVTLIVLLWDLTASSDSSRRRRRLRAGAWGVLCVTLAALFLLHYVLDRLGPLDSLGLEERPTFWVMHSLYLAACTLQWAAGLAYLGMSVSAWRAHDLQGEGKKEVRKGEGVEKEVGA